ncbi:hypothetical protein IB237_23500 [Agrobacterium sp. AGB01]|uniref:hypothetical protein n=1 Tax=Agrobacterium sp. AGB01 TaxID=2769302 RepID=UPI001782D136|nr:hypothetical protein [Agrobacterium sp. AGB01]MBD9390171.1 hypothetical protein [Agrobacterium sp. AGB01]
MHPLPNVAISIRQPWAWAIVYGGKPVENRDWSKRNPGLSFRGACCIHASQGMTRAEYEEASEFMASIGITCPDPSELQIGGIVGVTTITNIVSEMDSPWFFGPKGLVLTNTQPVDFIPAAGALGLFKWKRLPEGQETKRPKWMGSPTEPTKAARTTSQLTLGFGDEP